MNPMTKPEELAKLFGDPVKAHHPEALNAFAPVEKNTRFAFFELKRLGYPPHIAAALVGNIMQECLMKGDINPAAAGDQGESLGICQWNGKRRRALEALARKRNTNPDDLQTQILFLDRELQGRERTAYRAIMASRDVDEAAMTACLRFWRPGNPRDQRRVFYAKRVLLKLGGHQRSLPGRLMDATKRYTRGLRIRMRNKINRWTGRK